MSAFKQRMRKLGVRAGLLAGASAAVLAISGVSAGSAMATEAVCPNTSTINGKGSSLQNPAQEIWKVKYAGLCPKGPTVKYTSTGSGPGLEAFRFTGAGAINHEFQFIGTDDAPSRAQIEHAEEKSKPARPIIVPITQTAIAVGIHPPSGCKFKKGKGITWAELNKVFGGKTVTNWNQFTNVEGTCNEAIKRVVRAEGSGTTFQFKNYLSLLEGKGGEKLPCKVKVGAKEFEKWAEIEEVGTNEEPNKNWPCSVAEGGTKIITAAGGGKVAEAIIAEPGSIGYLSLPDAKNPAHVTEVALLQNGVVGTTPSYASPANEEKVKEGTEEVAKNTARCENARYTVPKEARAESGEAAGIAADWSGSFGGQPSIGGTEYPICTLTYAVGWTSYSSAGYGAESASWAAAVEDYVGEYIVAAGQKDINHKWYSTLPTGAGQETNVQEAAELAGMKIGVTCTKVTKNTTPFKTEPACTANGPKFPGEGEWAREFK
jgi:ABC-type phosphate transport system substrate-binding protein